MRNAIIQILIYLAILAACVLCGYWLYTTVMATDWPDWVKWLILRG